MSKTKLLLAVAGVIALGASYLAITQGLNAGDNGQGISSAPVFAASFKDLEGKPQPLMQWRGRVLVLNFWAPWCLPCREEIPDFIKLQEKYRDRGLVFIGVALDDKSTVRSFAAEMGINYPILLGETAAPDVAGKIGNVEGGIPFTVVIDRGGKIVASKLGRLDLTRLEEIALPLL